MALTPEALTFGADEVMAGKRVLPTRPVEPGQVATAMRNSDRRLTLQPSNHINHNPPAALGFGPA
jgi:hypothetical protein